MIGIRPFLTQDFVGLLQTERNPSCALGMPLPFGVLSLPQFRIGDSLPPTSPWVPGPVQPGKATQVQKHLRAAVRASSVGAQVALPPAESVPGRQHRCRVSRRLQFRGCPWAGTPEESGYKKPAARRTSVKHAYAGRRTEKSLLGYREAKEARPRIGDWN